MNCKRYKDALPMYAAGDLDSSERDKLEGHLKVCPDCRAELEKLSDVVTMLSPTGSDSLTDIEKLRLENAVYRRLAAKSSGANKTHGITGLIIRVAAVLVIFFSGYGAQTLISGPDKDQQTMPGVFEASLGMMSRQRPVIASGLRFSPEGLKIIARGKSALAGN
ncbi:MAG: zf-HC2 domain-containing protein [candidate division Zixibacteria bacterium]|nr:zf-HC2 domain-containing protein [candidate division Zixibacteria bacterium]